jgi:CheY-like chemotaxis protein
MQLPVYTHPTLTVLIDDSESFLKSLSFQLDPMLASKTFHDTNSALSWLTNSARLDTIPLQANFDTQNLPSDQCNVAVDLERIWHISQHSHRFATPSVLVVDYSMPQMNGIEFCQAIKHLPCKKILFTGTADEKIAVNAFNRGLIDRYIKKSDVNALDMLEREIVDLQAEFFAQQSETLRDLLVLHNYNFLRDAALTAVVHELSRLHGFVEHYVFPNPAGILFFDQQGKATLMIIETEKSMRAHYEIARDNDAPASLQSALLEQRLIPFFSDPDGDGMYSKAMGNYWQRYCRAPSTCQGLETYFWARFDLPAYYMQRPVLSYEQFLREWRLPSTIAA